MDFKSLRSSGLYWYPHFQMGSWNPKKTWGFLKLKVHIEVGKPVCEASHRLYSIDAKLKHGGFKCLTSNHMLGLLLHCNWTSGSHLLPTSLCSARKNFYFSFPGEKTWYTRETLTCQASWPAGHSCYLEKSRSQRRVDEDTRHKRVVSSGLSNNKPFSSRWF